MSNSISKCENSGIETGEIIGYKNGYILVKVNLSNACQSCGITQCVAAEKAEKTIYIKSNISYKLGETVLVKQSLSGYYISIGLSFGFPIILFFISLLILNSYLGQNLSILFSMLLIIIYYLFGKYSGMFKSLEKRFSYKILSQSK